MGTDTTFFVFAIFYIFFSSIVIGESHENMRTDFTVCSFDRIL